jgi:hypothetical protein
MKEKMNYKEWEKLFEKACKACEVAKSNLMKAQIADLQANLVLSEMHKIKTTD